MGFPLRTRPEIFQVDVFSGAALAGNPAAVVFGGHTLSDERMQAIARETNLSETVFMAPPSKGGDYAIRTFTTRREIPFAVHPSIAAAHAFAEASGFTGAKLRQECAIGLVEVQHDERLSGWCTDVPAAQFRIADLEVEEAASLLGLTISNIAPRRPEVVATGVPWLMIELMEAELLRSLDLDYRGITVATRRNRAVGITVFARVLSFRSIARMRSFAPAEGIFEDPVCGSCAGALAALLRRDDPLIAILPLIGIEQGYEIGRPGHVSVLVREDGIAVGGQAVTVMRGQLELGT